MSRLGAWCKTAGGRQAGAVIDIAGHAALLAALVLSFIAIARLDTSAATIVAPAENLRLPKQGHPREAFTVPPSSPAKCDIVLDGEIVSGDAAKLKQAYEKIEKTWEARGGGPVFLCLNSGGGSAREALEMARFLRAKWMIATVVEEGAICASACAYVFMAANGPGRSEDALPLRYLHPRARLLFHSSFIDSDQALDDDINAWARKDVADVRRSLEGTYSRGVRDVQAVIDFFNFDQSAFRSPTFKPLVRPSLFIEAFGQAKSEWLCIDTVDQAGRWDIQLYGFLPPKQLSSDSRYHACRNAFHWSIDRFHESTDRFEAADDTLLWDYLIRQLKFEIIVPKKGPHSKTTSFDERAIVTGARIITLGRYDSCIIDVSHAAQGKLNPRSNLTVSFADGRNGRQSSLLQHQTTAFFAPNVLLRDLAERQVSDAQTLPAPGRSFQITRNRVMAGCDLRRIVNASLESCKSACEADSKCKAFSYNRWRNACHLKDVLTDARLHPAWVTGAPVTEDGRMSFKDSIREKALVERYEPGSGGSYVQGLLSGKVIEEVSRPESECAGRCDYAKGCVGYTSYLKDGVSVCRTLSSIDSISHEGYANSAIWRTK